MPEQKRHGARPADGRPEAEHTAERARAASTTVSTVWGDLVFEPATPSGGPAPQRLEDGSELERLTASGRPRADRAAQFMPFAALRGYYELVEERKRVVEERHELTEEEAEALSRTVAEVRRGQIVRVTYYDRDAYTTMTGCVARIDLIGRELQVVKTRIALDDIRALAILSGDEGAAGRDATDDGAAGSGDVAGGGGTAAGAGHAFMT